MKRVREQATSGDNELLISMDPKATVKVGELSRNGTSRVPVKALDHDFQPDSTVTPVGLLLPQHDEFAIYLAQSKVTSDCIVDCLDALWTKQKARFPLINTIVLLLDNGPENSGRRTQFLRRIVQFVDDHHISVRLAYFPPYHSKYNPVERCWGILEKHWNGALLDGLDVVVGYAKTMTWKGKHPVVDVITKIYKTGVSLSKKAMKVVEERIWRLAGLPSYFLDIRSVNAK
jgi:hypothetical protein